KLQTGQIVTVNGTHGLVYDGVIQTAKEAAAKQVAAQATVAVSAPITATKVYVNLAEKELAADIAARQVDGVGLLRAEFMIADIGEHPKKMIKEGRSEEFITKLTEGLRMFAEPFHPRPVIYRATDFKTNEYRNLKGGEDYEMHEDNPMIGYRGCFRYISDPEVFNLEIEAIKRVREEFDNLHVMIPFVRTIEEMEDVKELMEKGGLKRSKNFKLYMMVEVPSTVFLIDKFCDIGIDGISIGSNDLTQLILGVDRDSELCASEFDERNEAVMMALEHLIKESAKKGVVASICGQAPSVYPEITEKLVEWGINSVSVSPDMIDTTRRVVASVERKMILKKLAVVNEQEMEELAILKK
ncbi:MAG TPA: phosphoenolpyruvate synthase, partial [bacterium]|nr:phosphoenolpyruvate synthase [bacterium]